MSYVLQMCLSPSDGCCDDDGLFAHLRNHDCGMQHSFTSRYNFLTLAKDTTQNHRYHIGIVMTVCNEVLQATSMVRLASVQAMANGSLVPNQKAVLAQTLLHSG